MQIIDTIFPNSLISNFYNKHLEIRNRKNKNYFFNNNSSFAVNQYDNIICVNNINSQLYLNKLILKFNKNLKDNGKLFLSLQTLKNRKSIIRRKLPVFISSLVLCLDFIFNRLLIKIPIVKYFCFWRHLYSNIIISQAEILGRLVAHNFKILETRSINDNLFVICKKIKDCNKEVKIDHGPLIKLKRIGKNGKSFNVYKLRTMHSYSQFLQSYVYELNSLEEGGKLKNDFRVSDVGRIFRKYWIDELPMLINIIIGQMKLVGVRPLSHHYFNLYSEELKNKRIKFKPGFIPPFYVDLPKTMDEIMMSEKKYLELYEKNPLSTDLKYLLIALYNVIFKGARSN